MKVVITIILAFGSAAAFKSGPYLPSGWRPQGPTFYLPTENQGKPENPVQVTVFQENEASGSDSLREYGPPKLPVVSFINQGLPDVVTDQIFQTVEEKNKQNIENEQKLITEVITEDKPVVTENSEVIETTIAEKQTTITDSGTIENASNINSTPVEEVTFTKSDLIHDTTIIETISNEEGVTTQSSVNEENSESQSEGRSLDINIQADYYETSQIPADNAENIQLTEKDVETNVKVLHFDQAGEDEVISTIANLSTEPIEISTIDTPAANNLPVENTISEVNVEITEKTTEQINNVEEKFITDTTAETNLLAEKVSNEANAEKAEQLNNVEEKLITDKLTLNILSDKNVDNEVNVKSTEVTTEQINNEEKLIADTIVVNNLVKENIKKEEKAETLEEIIEELIVDNLALSNLAEENVKNEINVETTEATTEQVNNVEVKLIEDVTTDLKEIGNVAVEAVNNISDALINLEKEVQAQQVETDLKAIQEISGFPDQAAEGFLEYGPPGFKEYGPPKEDELLRTLDQEIIGGNGVVSNELRKRRFSPKFKSTKKSH